MVPHLFMIMIFTNLPVADTYLCTPRYSLIPNQTFLYLQSNHPFIWTLFVLCVFVRSDGIICTRKNCSLVFTTTR